MKTRNILQWHKTVAPSLSLLLILHFSSSVPALLQEVSLFYRIPLDGTVRRVSRQLISLNLIKEWADDPNRNTLSDILTGMSQWNKETEILIQMRNTDIKKIERDSSSKPIIKMKVVLA